MNARRMLTVTLTIAAMLVLLTAAVRWLEPRMAFFPMRGEDVTPDYFHVSYQPLTIETHDGERLHAWAISGGTIRARILYFHGNGGNLSVWAPIVSRVAAHDY